jgi:hypothetical protein
MKLHLITLLSLCTSAFYAQDWTISPFNLKRDSSDQKKLWSIDPADNLYLSSQLSVTGSYNPAQTKTFVVRNKNNRLEGYAATTVTTHNKMVHHGNGKTYLERETEGMIEIMAKNDYAQCYALLTQAIESLKQKGVSEARLFFNLHDDPKLKEKMGYEALRLLNFVSEPYTEDRHRIVLRKQL